MKHSPAPWCCKPELPPPHTDGFVRLEAAGGERIAEIHRIAKWSDVCLIAASPRLFAGLRGAVEILDVLARDTRFACGDLAEWRELVRSLDGEP